MMAVVLWRWHGRVTEILLTRNLICHCMNHVMAHPSPCCFYCLQAARSSWLEVWSEELSRFYYYNPETREVSLDQPAGLVRQPGQGDVEV